MNSKSSNRKSQFEILAEELTPIHTSFAKDDLQSMLLQVDAMLIETGLFAESEESELANPIETLRGNLIGLSDIAGISRWYAVLTIYLFNRIQELEIEANSRLIEFALQSLNISKNYSEKAEQQSKFAARKEEQRKSQEGTHANVKGNELLDEFKKAAFDRYEPAIQSILNADHILPEEKKITYFSIAEFVYPKIEHLNRDKNGRKLIGRNGKPVEALAKLFKIAVSKKRLRSTIDYRKRYAP